MRVWEGVVGASARWSGALIARVRRRGSDRGDVPGWVLVTLMTAGLVLGLWAVAGDRLTAVFTTSIDRVFSNL